LLLVVIESGKGENEMSAIQRQTEDEDTFWRKLVLPQEERMRLGIPWHGGYRWFRSENVIPIEQARRKRQRSSQTPPTPEKR
jgi:hypothetical protein